MTQSAYAENYLLHWPAALLPENENMHIYEVHITLKCGYFKAANNLPDDWNFEIVRPISGISELHAEAGHGTSSIASMAEFNDVIKVSYQPEDIGCFELTAKIIRNDPEFYIEVKSGEFTLVPVQ